jgi:hypothetical protein
MKSIFLFLICLILTGTAAQNTQNSYSGSQPKSSTFNPINFWNRMDDYGKHFYVGTLITTVAGIATYKITKKKKLGLSILIGTATGISAGLFKEVVWDGMMHRGYPNRYDFIATMNGSLVGSFGLLIGFDLNQKKHDRILERYNKLRKQHSHE